MQAKSVTRLFEDPRAAAIADKILGLLLGTGPLLVLWTSEACSGLSGTKPEMDDVLSVAAVFELVHIASLVHDDIAEGSASGAEYPLFRWGAPLRRAWRRLLVHASQ